VVEQDGGDQRCPILHPTTGIRLTPSSCSTRAMKARRLDWVLSTQSKQKRQHTFPALGLASQRLGTTSFPWRDHMRNIGSTSGRVKVESNARVELPAGFLFDPPFTCLAHATQHCNHAQSNQHSDTRMLHVHRSSLRYVSLISIIPLARQGHPTSISPLADIMPSDATQAPETPPLSTRPIMGQAWSRARCPLMQQPHHLHQCASCLPRLHPIMQLHHLLPCQLNLSKCCRLHPIEHLHRLLPSQLSLPCLHP
jgi:hypothetical protein